MIARMGGGLGTVAMAGEMHAARGPHFVPRARRVIQLFMNGGPFQADLFDPKPLLHKYAGQRPEAVRLRTERQTSGLMPSPFRFRRHGESGLPISELLPHLSRHADRLCVIRSLHTDNPNHGPALLQINNGTISPTVPSMGSWLSYGLGTENENLPGYVVLCPGRPVRFSVLWTSAFLPAEHQGTYINHKSLDPKQMIPYLRNAHLDRATQSRQLELMRRVNRRHLERRDGDPQLAARLKSMETAFRMQFAATDAFDLARESKSVREAYGTREFGNGCLLARRLVERGVRFVQVYYGNGQPWDTHHGHNARAASLCRDIDRPIAALLDDLARSGLLEDTLVIWGGEFGRTPTTDLSEGKGTDGRDHNHYGFTMWLAGGGMKGGVAHGATDDFGFQAVTDTVHVHDLHATILHQMGLDHERLTYRYAGRDFRLTDVHGNVIHELLA